MDTIDPVLLIGLGGTGREVLLRMRRRFFMAGYQQQPWISYLWMDTEAGFAHTRVSKDLPKDYVTRKTCFADDEICNIGVTQQEAQGVNNNQALWQNIWEWADPESVVPALDQEGLTNGAKQQPPLGRLAVFVKTPLIIASLANRLEALQHDNIVAHMKELREDLRFQVQPGSNCKVILVGSLAGGTGAGCCIDIAAMLKAGQKDIIKELAAYNQLKSAGRYGFFLLPDAFCNDSTSGGWTNFKPDRVRANGYAMLQEIENLSLRRAGSGQALTGRDHAGQVHATWMNTSDMNAPWIDAPLYNNVFLFDGYGEGGTRLTDVRDCYSLMASVLFYDVQGKNKAIASAKSNEEYVQSRGHIEMYPPTASDYKSALWSDVYSFVFATAGTAQITFDAPRLRLTAAYAVAQRVVGAWLGESRDEPTEGNAVDEKKNAYRRDIGRLAYSVSKRLELELSCQHSPKGTRWSEVLKTRTRWEVLNDLRALQWAQRTPGFRVDGRFRSLSQTAAPWNAAALLEDLKKDFITGGNAGATTGGDAAMAGQRLPKLLPELIDKPPLGTMETGPQVYERQGGVRAAEWMIEKGGLLELKIAEFVAAMNRSVQACRATEKKLLPEADRACKLLDDDLANLDLAEKDFLALPGSVDRLKERIGKQFQIVQKLLADYGEAKYEAGMWECMAAAWDKLRSSPEYIAMLERGRARIKQTRFFLEDLLDRRPEKDGDLECGISKILADLRDSKWDHLTRILREDLHTDLDKLWPEILSAGGGSLDDEIEGIQKACLPKWRAKLMTLFDDGKMAEAPPEIFPNLIELANHSAMPREGQHRQPQPDKLDLSERLDGLYELASAQNCVTSLLAGEKINKYITDADREFLEKYSVCRLDLHREAQGHIRRMDSLCEQNGGVLRAPDEHRHLIAPNGFDTTDFFKTRRFDASYKSADELEARAFRVELSIPLPAVKALLFGSAAAANIDPQKLHFFKPKSGYTPIYRFDEAHARFHQKVYMHTLLGVLLGQFHAGEAPEDPNEIWCFEYRVASDGRPKAYQYWRSIPDIIRHLMRKENEDLLDEVIEKNIALLRDMSPVAMTALYLVIKYNLRWVAPQKVTFERIEAEQKKHGLDQKEYSPPIKGPQVLILEALLKVVAEQMNWRWQTPLDPGGVLQATVRTLEHFLHHFARFVPVNLRTSRGRDGRGAGTGENGNVKLLCLLTQVHQYIDLTPEEDLLLRVPPRPGQGKNPVYQRLGLRAPWMLCQPGTAAQTYEHHCRITGIENTSMRPIDDQEKLDPIAKIAQDERLAGTWNVDMLLADAPARDPQLYPQLLKSKTLIKDLDAARPLMQRRMELAAGVPASTPVKARPAAVTGSPIPAFFVAIGGKPSARALDHAALERCIQNGELTRQTKVWRSAMGKSWAPAGEVAELQALFPPEIPDAEQPPPLDEAPPPL